MECRTVADIIDTLRCEIKDPDGDIWSDKLLTDYIQQAYTHIASLRPDLFSEAKEITLERGKCLQSICSDCNRLVSVISIDGNDCTAIDQESSQDNLNYLNSLYANVDCPEEGEETVYNPTSWSFVDCGTCSQFRLSEPTPEDRDVTAIVCCTLEADFCQENPEDIEIPNAIFERWYEGFKHLILSKTYATDRKCEDLLKLSELHFKMWQDHRDWIMRVDFFTNQSNGYLYRQKLSSAGD